MSHTLSLPWNKRTVRDIEVRGRRVFCRVDFNVPFKNGRITDDTRIKRALPTIIYLMEQGAKIILATHLGYPKGKVVEALRIAPVAEHLSHLLGRPVVACRESLGPLVEQAIGRLQESDVLILENVRFLLAEEKDDPELATAWAKLADLYVNDAFATCHRFHTSISCLATKLPAVAGLLLEDELRALNQVITQPKRRFTSIIGGTKVAGKIGAIDTLLHLSDSLIIGGVIANTFLSAQGYELGTSLYESNKLQIANHLLKLAQELGVPILLPFDVMVEDTISKQPIPKNVVSLGPNDNVLDIGPATILRYRDVISTSDQVLWNGPMGMFEREGFGSGTRELLEAMATSHARTICGGGDTVAAVRYFGFEQAISYLSTGGGAMLKLLEGKSLPGITSLLNER